MRHASEIGSWLLDMDGVLVREEHPIDGANRFLDILRESETPFLVLTNNSMYTRRDLSARLNFGGLNVPEHRVQTRLESGDHVGVHAVTHHRGTLRVRR